MNAENESIYTSPETFSERNKRGPAKCDTVATESSKRMKVNFNERGQPIGDESNKLVSFVGANVRKIVDMTIHDWRKVSPGIKETLWTATKQKFILKEEAREYVMKDVGCLWRLGKSRLHSLIDACKNESELREARPKRVGLEQWKSLIRLHRSRAFQKKIQKINDKSVEDSSLSLKDDALSQVFGPEPSGHVRALGFGVTPSKVGIITQHKEKVVQLEQEVEELSKKVASMESTRRDLEEKIRQEMQESLREEMRGAIREECQEQINTMQSLVNQLLISQGYEPMFGTSSSAHQVHSTNKNPLVVKCKLFRMDEEDIVAEGVWLSDNPDMEAQGIKLGSGASKVMVEHVIESTARLWKPCNGNLKDIEGEELVYNLIKRDILEEEKKNGTLSKVARDGTHSGHLHALKTLLENMGLPIE
ncbi:hypothetical protein AQUCO_01500482v1 [Aquilegia coerulea]|uniref:Uncharacterized protein n=1 Tax=Aquilegia coerulea TaxID=218851 RepID=A0A2G5DTX8_AQUCA|nr:hypothetical protein AQUCO_01500482v1 [Aquilegia coerulea]